MGKRTYLYIIILIVAQQVYGQPVETILQGTVAREGHTTTNTSYGPLNIGFNFIFYGNSYSQFYASTKGLVTFGSNSTTSTEAVIPSAALPNNMIAAFWDNLIIDGSGSIMYTTVGAAPNRKCIIQFRNMGFSPFPVYLGTFQVILYETSNKIQVQYRLIVDNRSSRNRGGSASIGIENLDGSAGVQYRYQDEEAVSTGLAISFTPDGLGSYTMNENEEYEFVFVTKNILQPEPGITRMITPAEGATIGTDVNFEWNSTPFTSYYTLYLSNYSDLSDPVIYSPGSDTTWSVAGLMADTTYYWAVFATNPSSTSWCEIRMFSTSSTPPLSGEPRTIWVEQGEERLSEIKFTGGDGSAVTATVTTLPAKGSLYQVNSGTRGAQINTVPSQLSDPGRKFIYVADGGAGSGAGSFGFYVSDATGDSPAATYTINVNPPGVPNFMLAARSTGVEIQFDRPMNNPSGKESQFTVTADGSPVTVTAAALKPGDNNSIILTLATPLAGTEVVLVSYTMGDVSATTGGMLETFINEPAVLIAQTITFPAIPVKTYGDPDYVPGALASGGGPVLYSSANPAVATIVTNRLRFVGAGESVITGRQAGDAIYAPARYERSLTVVKANQTITFPVLPAKTYGDADFSPGAAASSGLQVTYSSGNTSVATIIGGMIHITGAGSSVITASQTGDNNYNPAPEVQRTLTVNKANQTITFNPLPVKDYGDGDFTIEGSSSSGLVVSFISSNTSVATISGNLVHITGGGATNITASQPGNSNYNPAEPVVQILNVNKVTLTVAADNKTRVFNEPNPPLTFSINGFVLGETQAVIDQLPAATTTATQTSDVGTYPISFSGGNDNSYDFSFVEGTLNITQATQTIAVGQLPPSVIVGQPLGLTAISSGGLDVIFETTTPTIATITGNQLTGIARGTAQIRAYNNGNANYLAAEAFASVEITNTHQDVLYLFTPNGDGFNDLWEIPNKTELGKCDVRVYNRWGKLLFADDDYNNDWDGTSEGRPLPEGAYVFVIKTENQGLIKGTVNIVR